MSSSFPHACSFTSTQGVEQLRTEYGAKTFARAMGYHLVSLVSRDQIHREISTTYGQYVKASALRPAVDAKEFNRWVLEGIEEAQERRDYLLSQMRRVDLHRAEAVAGKLGGKVTKHDSKPGKPGMIY